MMDAGLMVSTAFISPANRERERAKSLIGVKNFVGVFVSTSLAVCEQRDVKGLYKKARSGLLPNMTGIDSPYETPDQADIEIDGATLAIDAAVQILLSRILCVDPREL